MHWTTNDSVPSVRKMGPSFLTIDGYDSAVATGVGGYSSQAVAIGPAPGAAQISQRALETLLREFIGELRFVWALLAAINDTPLATRNIAADGGYVARGRYRKFLDHTTISIILPRGRDATTVAREIIERMRRRRHDVRGHWRDDWRFPGAPGCEHDWLDTGDTLICQRPECGKRRMWIHEHARGDASLGFVRHDYAVTHQEPTP